LDWVGSDPGAWFLRSIDSRDSGMKPDFAALPLGIGLTTILIFDSITSEKEVLHLRQRFLAAEFEPEMWGQPILAIQSYIVDSDAVTVTGLPKKASVIFSVAMCCIFVYLLW